MSSASRGHQPVIFIQINSRYAVLGMFIAIIVHIVLYTSSHNEGAEPLFLNELCLSILLASATFLAHHDSVVRTTCVPLTPKMGSV
jgi:hypothetical protein